MSAPADVNLLLLNQENVQVLAAQGLVIPCRNVAVETENTENYFFLMPAGLQNE